MGVAEKDKRWARSASELEYLWVGEDVHVRYRCTGCSDLPVTYVFNACLNFLAAVTLETKEREREVNSNATSGNHSPSWQK